MDESSFDAVAWNLRDILASIDNGSTALPDFQRDFVWDKNRVISLIASLSDGHPTGSLLTYALGKNKIFAYRNVDSVKSQESIKPDRLVLDGQQRLTALYQAFYGRGKHRYYIDVKSLKKSNEIEESIISIQIDIARKKYGTLNQQFESVIIPLPVLYDFDEIGNKRIEYMDWLAEYHKYYNGKNMELTLNDIRSLLKIYHDRIKFYKFPKIELSENTSSESICRIFENLNMKGMRLTVFEILTAKLITYNINLRKLWKEIPADSNIKIYLKNLGSTYILKTIMLINDKEPKSCKNSDILELSANEIKKYWNTATKYLNNALKELKDEYGVISKTGIPYITMLPPLAAMLYNLDANSKSIEYANNHKIIKQWYWYSVFSQRYDAATDTRSVEDLKKIILCIRNDKPMNHIQNFNFDANELRSIENRNNAIYKGIMCLLLKNGASDFYNWKENKNIEKLDDHHVFPSAYLKNKNIDEFKNSILNKTLISSKTNKEIGSSDPAKYLLKIKNTARYKNRENEFYELLKRHKLIRNSSSPIFSNQFNKFLEERQKLLDELINSVLK